MVAHAIIPEAKARGFQVKASLGYIWTFKKTEHPFPLGGEKTHPGNQEMSRDYPCRVERMLLGRVHV